MACHGLGPIQAEDNSAEEWREELDRNRHESVQLTAEERETLIQYLAQYYGER